MFADLCYTNQDATLWHIQQHTRLPIEVHGSDVVHANAGGR